MTTFPQGSDADGVQVEDNGDINFTPDFKWDSANKILQIAGKISSRVFENVSTATLVVGATDTLIFFTDISSDPIWGVAAGVITAKIDLEGAKAQVELHIDRTGGGPSSILQLWREISIDNGVNFEPVPNSLRQLTLDSDGDGNFSFGASVNQPIPAGTQFKLLCKNIGSGTLTIASSSGTNGDAEALTGFSEKLTIG